MREKWSVQMICDQCGTEFECVHRKRLETEHHFCSKACEIAYRHAHKKYNCQCAVCGKPLYKTPYQLEKIKYEPCCSRQCAGKYRETLYLGENNPNFGNRGSLNPIWKSDERVSVWGYRLIRQTDHPYANSDGFVFEHRLVAEQYLLTPENRVEINGKYYLSQEYVVHHIDHNRLNNDVTNLRVMTKSDHMRMHAMERRAASLNPEKSVEPTADAMVIPRSDMITADCNA